MAQNHALRDLKRSPDLKLQSAVFNYARIILLRIHITPKHLMKADCIMLTTHSFTLYLLQHFLCLLFISLSCLDVFAASSHLQNLEYHRNMQLYLTGDPVMVVSPHPPYDHGRDIPIANHKMLSKAYCSRSCSSSVYPLGEEHVPPPAVLPQIKSPTQVNPPFTVQSRFQTMMMMQKEILPI
jgi:hypothetical protein